MCQHTLERVERVVDHPLTPLVLGIITAASDGVTLEELHDMLTSSSAHSPQAAPTADPTGSAKVPAQTPSLGVAGLKKFTKQERFDAEAAQFPAHVVGVVVGAVQSELAGYAGESHQPKEDIQFEHCV